MNSSDSDKPTYEVPQYKGPLTRLGLVTNEKLDIGHKPLPKPHRFAKLKFAHMQIERKG
ncbi:6636_t:CDS:2 [Acaulospora colombiana]|uniref:6636_t:CDS:1 n=1 Tax=Acaulospora colombiana TaxID=27376 RepID=A0ACA9JVK1_9GLOM|nr:6636_t:CDS:2 [Acaulospora colombiana]